MNAETECPHGLDARWCATCLHGPAKKHDKYRAERTITARYDGRCPNCGHRIEEGDTLGLADGDWLCGGCIESTT